MHNVCFLSGLISLSRVISGLSSDSDITSNPAFITETTQPEYKSIYHLLLIIPDSYVLLLHMDKHRNEIFRYIFCLVLYCILDTIMFSVLTTFYVKT